MARLDCIFSLWTADSPSARDLQKLLSHEAIWETQRSDHFDHELVINRSYAGSFLSIFSKDSKPVGFVIYVPQNFTGLYEMHMGFLPKTSAFTIRDCLLKSISDVFFYAKADKIAAPCPDWNYKLSKMARMIRRCLGLSTRSIWTMRVPGYALRDNHLYGATVHAISAEELKAERTSCQ